MDLPNGQAVPTLDLATLIFQVLPPDTAWKRKSSRKSLGGLLRTLDDHAGKAEGEGLKRDAGSVFTSTVRRERA